jgi:putative DNA primase/helicase
VSTPLRVEPGGIPDCLTEKDRWVCWRTINRGGKPTKKPFDPLNGRGADCNDPQTWASYGTAWQTYQDQPDRYDGVGYELGGGFSGTDIDECVDPATGEIAPWAWEIIRELDSYTEYSPTDGVKVFHRGEKPPEYRDTTQKPYHGAKVEIYDRGRYFTVTGRHVGGTPRTVNDRGEALARVCAMVFGPPPQPHEANGKEGVPGGTAGPEAAPADGLTDEEIIARATGGTDQKFRDYWAGSTAHHDGDESRADMALVEKIYFYLGSCDKARADRLFRLSGLMREKWDEKRGQQTYGERTLDKQAKQQTGFYTRPRGPRVKWGQGGCEAAEEAAHRTDLGNARRVVERHGADLRYCHPWKSWLTYDGVRWAPDETAEAVRCVKETQAHLYRTAAKQIAELGDVGDDKERQARLRELTRLLKHALSWEDARAIGRSLDLARSEPGVPVLPADLDRDPMLLNVLNGTLDLRTGELRPHGRADLITKLAPVAFDPAATCPRWAAFVRWAMGENDDLIDYLQKVVGYWLTGSVAEQALWFFHGGGANGKSTFLGVVLALLGDYAIQAVSDLLMEKRGDSHPTERADLFGRRFVATIETEDGRRMAEALMKQLSGGDRVRARRLYQNHFEFDPTFKIVLAANHKPAVRGTDLAVWRRIKLVPFAATVTDEKKDKHLPDKLRAELPGILNWALAGCLAWQRDGLGEPDEVRQATAQYQAEQDSLGEFLRECCTVLPEARCRASALFDAYAAWSGDRLITLKTFGTLMRAKGYESKRGGGGPYFWHGVGLPATAFSEPSEA